MIVISVPDCSHPVDNVKKVELRKVHNPETDKLDLVMAVTTQNGVFIYPFDEYNKPITLLKIEFDPNRLPKSFGDGDD